MVSRRKVLAISAGLVVAGSAVAGGVANAGQLSQARGTVMRRRVLTGGRLRVPRCRPVSHLALTWQGGKAQVRLRTASGWSQWTTIDGCTGAPDATRRPRRGAVISTGAAAGYDVWLTGNADVYEISAPADETTSAANGMPLPDGSTCLVPYLSRAAWGADESLRYVNGVETWPPEFAAVQTLTVHHTAGTNNDPDPAATVRAIYHYQTVGRGWGDIGYHMLIDEAGVVYQGRWTGPDAGPAWGGVAGPDGVYPMGVGGHVLGFNTGNIGIAVLGTYTNRALTDATRATLVNVLAGLARAYRLDPQGTTDYVNPVTGAARTVRTISGHRNWAATDCPGDLCYADLPAIRLSVAAAIPPPLPYTTRPRTGPQAPRRPLP